MMSIQSKGNQVQACCWCFPIFVVSQINPELTFKENGDEPSNAYVY